MIDPPDIFPARHFTVQTLAKYWEVSPSHIYNLVYSNAIRHLRIGKSIRIPIHFVKEYEEAACQITTTSTAYGNIQTDIGTSYGHQNKQMTQISEGQSAYQRGQQTVKRQSGSAPNTSQD